MRSPLYNHFTETLDGLVTLRAYHQIWRAKQLNEEMINLNSLVSFANLCANRWLSMRLELMSSGLIFCATVLAVLSSGSLEPAFAGDENIQFENVVPQHLWCKYLNLSPSHVFLSISLKHRSHAFVRAPTHGLCHVVHSPIYRS